MPSHITEYWVTWHDTFQQISLWISQLKDAVNFIQSSEQFLEGGVCINELP